MISGLSIIVPVYNEEDIIVSHTLRLVGFLETLDRPFEVLLVSNGSTDATDALGADLARDLKPVRFFSLKEKGVGRAFVLAVNQANFDLLVSVDMDLSIDLDFFLSALDLLTDFQIVVGSKKMGSQQRPGWRKLGSGAFIMTARLLLGLSFEDYSIAAKAYRREAIQPYLSRLDPGTSYVLELLFHTLSDGGRAVEVPVRCEDFRTSKFNLLHEALYRFHHLLVLWKDSRIQGKKLIP